MIDKEYFVDNPEIITAIQNLIQQILLSPSQQHYFEEMCLTISKFATENKDIGDLKMINTSLKELRYSFKLFAPYRDIRKVCIFGSARIDESVAEYQLAQTFSEIITKKGYMIITGAGSGVMEAGNRGSQLNTSFGVKIKLPFERTTNPYIANDEKLLTFKYFFNRKVIFIKESDATVLFPGGFGTHDEAFENITLLQTGKCAPRPIIFIDSPENSYWNDWLDFVTSHLLQNHFILKEDLGLFKIVHTAEAAVDEIVHFYKVYHSIRYIEDMTILRLNFELSDQTIQELNAQFKDILLHGKIEKLPMGPLPFDDDKFPDKHRIVCYFDRYHYGRLIQMIHYINHSYE